MKKNSENNENYNLRIQDMSSEEKPGEKLLNYGAEFLSDAELLAIILRTGTTEMNVINLAQRILNSHPVYKGLAGLNYLTQDDLMKISGVGKTKAAQILAVNELSKRMSSQKYKKTLSLDSPSSIADYFMEKTRYLTVEKVFAVYMSSSHNILREVLISTGSIDRSLVSAREIFANALKCDASCMVIIHNHPSGNPEPSEADIMVTTGLVTMGKQLGVSVLDHIILGDKCFISLRERGIL